MRVENKNADSLSGYKMVFEQVGSRTPGEATNIHRVQKAGKANLLVRNTGNRLVRSMLRRCSIQLLDQALRDKTGKLPTRSVQARREAKSYNEGYQQALIDYWIKT